MVMCLIKFVLITISFLILVSSEVLPESRQPRIFTFNADSEDVEVGFDFSIPFLKIPIKKTFDAVGEFGFHGLSLPKINLNPTALVLGGLLIISTSFLAPLLNKATAWHPMDRSSRALWENGNNEASFYVTERLLANSRGCPERIACWSSQRTSNPEVINTLKQIMSNKLLSSMINETALEIATVKGRSGQRCELYAPCPIDEKALPKILHSYSVLTNLKSRENFI